MAPVTDFTPKPLLPFFNVELLRLSVGQLAHVGVERIAINARHLADQVEAYVLGDLARIFPDVAFHVSIEEDVLGTGGALVKLRPWLRPKSFWVLNSDAVFAQDLSRVAQVHAAAGNAATLLVTRAQEHAALRFLKADPSGRLLERTPGAEESGFSFCGVHLNEFQLLEHLPQDAESCVLRAGHLPWAASGARVALYETQEFWADVGTPERYLDAHLRAHPSLDAWLPRAKQPPP